MTAKTDALAALDGMTQIVEAEMLTRGVYRTEVQDESRLWAICGGRRHCAIGALWVGAGVEPLHDFGDRFLPGVEQSARAEFLKARAGLKLAYDALNHAAVKYADAHDIGVPPECTRFDSELEDLFENGEHDDGTPVGTHDVLAVIAIARSVVETERDA